MVSYCSWQMVKSANYSIIPVYALFIRGQNLCLNYPVPWHFDLGLRENTIKNNITYLAYIQLFIDRQLFRYLWNKKRLGYFYLLLSYEAGRPTTYHIACCKNFIKGAAVIRFVKVKTVTISTLCFPNGMDYEIITLLCF